MAIAAHLRHSAGYRQNGSFLIVIAAVSSRLVEYDDSLLPNHQPQPQARIDTNSTTKPKRLRLGNLAAYTRVGANALYGGSCSTYSSKR